MSEDDVGDVLALPYTRVIGTALGWMTLDEVRECVARVRARGGRVSGMFDDDELAQAHPARVHAILQRQTPGYEPFFEVRLWKQSARRSFGCPLDLEADEVAGFPLHPDPIYHELVAPMERGFLTE